MLTSIKIAGGDHLTQGGISKEGKRYELNEIGFFFFLSMRSE